jgi:acetyltransferase
MSTHYLDRLFSPRAIAVFGASDKPASVGNRVLENLTDAGYRGAIYPINPKYAFIHETPCYSSIDQIDQTIDLAIIATPADTVPEIIQACGEHGVRAAIIISAGFGESTGQGLKLQQQMLEIARQYNMRLLGPNCLGLIRPAVGMNATFSQSTAKAGQLALVSQSGALCTAILDWAAAHDVGFSSIVSLGNAADVDFGDILDYLAQDPKTRGILLYVEGIRDARSFISGLRVAARMKPVVVIKAGRHSEGSRAALSHTGALFAADDVFDAALQRAGVIRAYTIEQMFAAARLLARQYRVQGNRLAIITNGGGLGVMATDRVIDLEISLAQLSAETQQKLNEGLPAHWSHGNPIDLLGDATPDRYHIAVKACLGDPNVDGVLVMLSPQAMTDALGCAEATVAAVKGSNKPVLTCWMGEQQVEPALRLFAREHLPSFASPESCVEAFSYLANFYRNQQLLMQVPGPLGRQSEPDIHGARQIISRALAQGRNQLTLNESKAILSAFAIPVSESIECETASDALVAAEAIGYPVVMKINSPDVTHKSDVNGVRLNIGSAKAILNSFDELQSAVLQKIPEARLHGVTIEPMWISPHGRELMIGASRDPVFGSVIVFSAGGVRVEILHDRAVALPPLNTFLAHKMIHQTHVSKILRQFRDLPPINMDILVRVLRRVSEMICALPEIISMDINPLVADESGVMALDARMIVEQPAPSFDRYDHLAIHPYPAHLVSQWQLHDGTEVTIRPIRPEDATIEQEFMLELSEQSRYLRFMQGVTELTQDMLIRFTQLDYHRELALLATIFENGKEVELGVTRYVMNPDGESCEFALVVADRWQHQGVGSRLMKALMAAAKDRGFRIITGEVLGGNHAMLKLVDKLGFKLQNSDEDPAVKIASRYL